MSVGKVRLRALEATAQPRSDRQHAAGQDRASPI